MAVKFDRIKGNWYYLQDSTVEGSNIYAVIDTGGRQYKVAPGDKIKVDKIPLSEGSVIEYDKVLLIADGDKTQVGKPFIANAKVSATCISHGKDEKIIVYKYKPKKAYYRKTGHRQPHTKLSIDKIITGEGN